MPTAVNTQSDSDVLSRKIVTGKAPARFYRHSRRVGRFWVYIDDQAAQFARRPQRVEHLEIVVGQQRGGRAGRQTARHVDPGLGGLDAFGRRFAPSSEAAKRRTHSRSRGLLKLP